MINNPLISIITVTFNAQEFLEQTIKSVITQDYKNIEYIIIDGGSNDMTIDIIKKYNDFISLWISEPDKGIYDAMNKAINLATGEWINFMNAGDYFYNNSVISKVFKLLNKNSSLIYGDTIFINENTSNKRLRKATSINSFWKSLPFNHNALFCKTSLLKKFHFNLQYKIVADSEFILRCILSNEIFQYIPLIINYYLEGGFSDQNKRERTLERWLLLNKTDFIDKETLDFFYFDRLSKDTIKTNISEEKQKFNFSVNYSNFFNKINELKKSKFTYIIYGYGSIGKTIHSLIPEKIIGIVDKNSDIISDEINTSEILNPKSLIYLKFDKIVISILSHEKEIITYLIDTLKIKKNKIIIINI